MSNDYSLNLSAPISKTVHDLTASIVREWGNSKHSVLVRHSKFAKARKRPANKIVIEEMRDSQGRIHCEDGPALKLFLPGNPWPVLEAHFIAGQGHRAQGPCVTQKDPKTHFVTRELFGQNNALHNRWRPAVIETSSATSDVRTRETWMWRGKLHRACGPADIRRGIRSKRITHAEWHLFNQVLCVMDLRKKPVNDGRIIDLHRKLIDRDGFPKAFDFKALRTWRHSKNSTSRTSLQSGPI